MASPGESALCQLYWTLSLPIQNYFRERQSSSTDLVELQHIVTSQSLQMCHLNLI